MAITRFEILNGILTGNAVFYSQVESADPEFNTEVISVIAAGDTHPKFVSCNGSKSAIPFDTQAVGAALAELGNFGNDLSVCDLFYRAWNNLTGPVAAGSALHTRWRANLAFGFISNITAGHRKPAMAKVRIIPVTDGAVPDLVRSGTEALTEIPDASEVFTLGSVLRKDLTVVTIFEGCDNLDVNFNAQVFERSDESDESTTFAALESISPVVSFTTTDGGVAAFNKTAVTDFRFHLLRNQNGACHYADVETQHIRGVIDNGLMVVQSVSGKPAEYRVEVYAIGDNATGFSDTPIVWSVNVAVDEA